MILPKDIPSNFKSDTVAMAERYARRSASQYGVLRPEMLLSTQEWYRKLAFLLGGACGYGSADLASLNLVDVGCGHGGHLLEFLRLGFMPENLTGIELLPDRLDVARSRVPERLRLHEGDACVAPLLPQSQDIVFQSVVFSLLLDDDFQHKLAQRMWSWLRPGGGVMWYDFTFNNPNNSDVRGVPLRRVRELFPEGLVNAQRVTLAPPISRRVAKLHPSLYTVFNALPFLRTHLLCWIAKPVFEPFAAQPSVVTTSAQVDALRDIEGV